MRPFLTIAVIIFAILADGFAAKGSAEPQDGGSTVMLVIDGSGSMWGRLDADKRAKIDMIRDLLRAPLLAPTKAKIGLTSFGHRRKSDCSDVEVIAEPSDNRDVVSAPLEKLNPRGKGPLVSALKTATAALGQSRPASLLVINDGVDNCQQDTCAFASEFAKASPGIPIHMISIGISPEERPRLSCIAQATGGTFYDVQDAQGLATAIDAATQLAMLSPKTAAPSPAQSDKTAPSVPAGASLRIAASLSSGTPVLNIPMRWRIFKAGDTRVIADSDAADISARLDPGNYEVEVQIGTIVQRQAFAIEAGKPLSLIVPLNAVRLAVRLKSAKDGNTISPALIAVRSGTADQAHPSPGLLSYGEQLEAVLPPGPYVAAVTLGQIRQEKSITLDAGADKAIDFDPGSGQLEVTAALSEGGPALEDVTFGITEDDPDSPDGKRDVARSRASTARFTLPAGTYYVSARSGEAEVRQRIAVGAGDTVRRTLVLPVVPVKLSAVIAGRPVADDQNLTYRVALLEGDTAKVILRAMRSSLDLVLLPGRYRFAAHLNANHISASQDVVLEAGKHADVSIKIDAAEVALKGPPPSPGTENFWQINDPEGKHIWNSLSSEANVFLPPGRYVVKLENRDKILEAAFEVRSGEHKTLQLGAAQ